MAQQTINVGTAPNDGTGTPLRTAFQYTNSNFSELYTAVGPSGNNIVVPGNATITGDLTVDTSTLKVVSASDVVGINTTSPLTGNDAGLTIGAIGTVKALNIGLQNTFARLREKDAIDAFAITTNITASNTQDDATKSSWKARMGFGNGNDNFIISRSNVGSTTFYDLLAVSTGSCVWYDGAGGTRMTLNSTGLGVGASPAQKLTVAGSAEITGGVVGQGALIGRDGSSGGATYSSNTGNTNVNAPASGSVRFNVNNGVFAGVFDANANLGIGVTPSAWATSASRKAIQLSTAGSISAQDTGTAPYTFVASNWVSTATGDQYILGAAAPATLYRQFNGTHAWYYAGAGTGSLTFTQAMTLDASGNLLVGTTSSPSGTKVGAIAKLSGVSAEGTAAINVSTTPVAISRNTGVCGLFFVMGYNASGGAQGWYLVASTGSGTPTVISSGGTPGLTLTFTMAGGQLNAQTASGTFVANAFSITA